MNPQARIRRIQVSRLFALGAWLVAGWGIAQADAVAGEEPVGGGSESALRRDPFWPVGYAPSAGGAALAEDGVDPTAIRWPSLPVLGRARAADGTFRVLIDGLGVVGENKVVAIQENGIWFRWRILRIDDKGVESMRLGISRKRPVTAPVPTTIEMPESRKENAL